MPAEIRSGDHILLEMLALVYSAHILEMIDSSPVMPLSAVMSGVAFPFGMCNIIVSSI